MCVCYLDVRMKLKCLCVCVYLSMSERKHVYHTSVYVCMYVCMSVWCTDQTSPYVLA